MGKRWKSPRVFAAGLVMVMAILSAVPGVIKAVGVPGPGWVMPVVLAVAAGLLTAVKPWYTVANEAAVARTKDSFEQDTRVHRAWQDLPVIKTVAETDPALLGIHPSIPLPADAPQSLSPDLPEYVERNIDADLRNHLRARASKGGFVLLVGASAAGKTRTAWEAISNTLPDWKLIRPNPGGDLAWVESRNLGRSVIWLNELQDFLTSTNPIEAATVRRLLADTTQPVILLGTIWHDLYDQLRAGSSPAPMSPSAPLSPPVDSTESSSNDGNSSDRGADTLHERRVGTPNRNYREVLEQARVFSLPAFTQPEWERARELASHDPRLAHATANTATGLDLTQILSAAPELILRWEQADNPYGKALISAAVTARRCGHPPTIPAPVLQALATTYLTGQQRADAPDDWFQQGLTWACKPVQRTHRISPLSAYGNTPGHTDGHRVSDILTNHTHPTSPVPEARGIPEATWNVLIQTADAQACLGIGRSADAAGRRPNAAAAWTRAAEANDTTAMVSLGMLADEDGDRDTARTWYSRAAENGDTDAMVNLGVIADEDGDRDTARTWYTRAANAGDADAMFNLALLADEDGDRDTARTWYSRAAENGDTDAMVLLGLLADEDDDGDTARTWYSRAAENGDTDAMVLLGLLADEDGDRDTARTWYSRAAENGDTDAMVNLGVLAEDDGDRDTARTWYTRAANAGAADAMFNLGVIAAEDGDRDTARTWYTRAANAGDTDAMFNLGVITAEDGDRDTARTWYTRAANADDTHAMFNLGLLAEDDGDRDTARIWYTRAANAGDTDAMFQLGLLARNDGDRDTARTWYTRAANAGDTDAMFNLGVITAEDGDRDTARTWYTRAASKGHTKAETALAQLPDA
ncbi:sel1 repeat family protein [Streptomyces sp. MC1]|uniref:tetratricopeptide repeat protein n=1 Tax=Streptomyces sp. MC1 TaxID=295105 RepID=UPI0018CB02FE|nr:tetratricopeptide repeat protein [Streptomyces sp. MC1]MBG7704689.1 sel1 repeat family protein [Streptomyces sp. MC1]